MSFDRGLDKEDMVHIIGTMECHSVIRKDEILPFATKWIDLENIMLSKIGQLEKTKNHMISLICEI